MTNVINAITLITEVARLSKLCPAVFLAFARIAGRATPAFVTRDIHPRFFLGDDEGLVHRDILRNAETLRLMDPPILGTSRPLLRTGPQRVSRDESCDLPPQSGTDLVRRAEVDSRIYPRINNFCDTCAECVPLTRDARNCDHERHARIVLEQ